MNWRSMGNFHVSVKIYSDNETLIPAGITLFFDEVGTMDEDKVFN